MEQVEASMQKFKAEGRSPFEIDAAWLARQPPGLLLTQDTCQACDPSTTFVTEVRPPCSSCLAGVQCNCREILSKRCKWMRLPASSG